MDITVYRVKDGHYVLVPARFLPSMDCRHEHGRLTRCGQISTAGVLCAQSWQRVVSQIDQHCYAIVTANQAARLLGPEHPCIQHGGAFAEPLEIGMGELAGIREAAG